MLIVGEKCIGVDLCVLKEDLIDHGDIIEDDNCLRLRGGFFVERLWKLYDDQRRKKSRDPVKFATRMMKKENLYRKHAKWLETTRGIRKSRALGKLNKGIWAAVFAKAMRNRLRKAGWNKRPKPEEPELDDDFTAKYSGEGEKKIKTMLNYREKTSNRGLGRLILNRKLATERMYHSYCRYAMSIALKSEQNTSTLEYRWHMDDGNGPHLYTRYNVTVNNGTERNFALNQPIDPVWGSDDGIGRQSPCYIFAADWPWLTMNHDVNTQSRVITNIDSRYLSWTYAPYQNQTDNNLPLKVSDFILNEDWKYLKIYGCQYIFDMTNNDIRPYCVEILLFKFKADPDTMDFSQQAKAVYANQANGFASYVNKPDTIWNHQDIKVVFRKRFYLQGADSPTLHNLLWVTIPIANKNTRRVKLNVFKEYTLTRPILENYDNLTEDQFFSDYYEPTKGVYMRIQAWPQQSHMSFNFHNATLSNTIYNNIESINYPSSTTVGNPSTTGFGVDVKIWKKGFFKFDSERIKTIS